MIRYPFKRVVHLSAVRFREWGKGWFLALINELLKYTPISPYHYIDRSPETTPLNFKLKIHVCCLTVFRQVCLFVDGWRVDLRRALLFADN